MHRSRLSIKAQWPYSYLITVPNSNPWVISPPISTSILGWQFTSCGPGGSNAHTRRYLFPQRFVVLPYCLAPELSSPHPDFSSVALFYAVPFTILTICRSSHIYKAVLTVFAQWRIDQILQRLISLLLPLFGFLLFSDKGLVFHWAVRYPATPIDLAYPT
jgi:hypothetical protein